MTAYPLRRGRPASLARALRRADRRPRARAARARRRLGAARSERSCHLFTVLGTAGVGKSRLDGRVPRRARRDRGPRPLPLLRRGDHLLAGGRGRAAARPRPWDPRAAGSPRCSASRTRRAADEIAWAFRRLLEEAAPVGRCVFDDLHWAEPTFLDLDRACRRLERDAPILLLCIARPELLDRRPTWARRKAQRHDGPARAAPRRRRTS